MRLSKILAIALACGSPPRAAADEDYLSDILNRGVVRHTQEWGSLGVDTAVNPNDGRQPMPLRIADKTFAKGLGSHANGEIVVDLGGRYESFEAVAGVAWQGGDRGSVIFRVIVDGTVRFESARMSDSDPGVPVNVSLAGAREIRLVAADAGDGIGCDCANWAEARLTRDPRSPSFGVAAIALGGGAPAPPPSASACGFFVIAADEGPQIAFTDAPAAPAFIAAVRAGESIEIAIPVRVEAEALALSAEIDGAGAGDGDGEAEAEASLALDAAAARKRAGGRAAERIDVAWCGAGKDHTIRLVTRGVSGEAAVRWREVHLRIGERSYAVTAAPPRPREGGAAAAAVLPALRPPIERALIEWDWRMQDGIGTKRAPSTYAEAIERTIARGSRLMEDLAEAGISLDAERAEWERLRASAPAGEAACEAHWREVHELRRRIALRNPLADTGPIAFVKQVPGLFSHQLTQYYGRYARPGGGVFVLDRPGESMRCRALSAGLPSGSAQHLDVSYDGRRILFSFCETNAPAADAFQGERGKYYHLYEVGADGDGLRKLTDGPFDDFAPRYLPDGRIVFISTRRLGWHRCGFPGCETYTLAIAEGDGSDARPISYHETHEWDPAVLHDGRIIYTRWDYVDRHAVYYEQLWTARGDGSAPAAFYGNNTFNPVGVWEPRAVPGSDRVIATAAAHHAMTAGSIILVQGNRGVDGPAPIERLTPDAPFPESETAVAPRAWYAPAGIAAPPPVPVEAERWPGHCYRSPYPLSETYFLAAYSFDALIGEPDANPANMWGIYLVDRFGNKELLYRDPSIASLWPMPIGPRIGPPVLKAAVDDSLGSDGTFFIQDVHASDPAIPPGSVARIRIVQVLPKSTPGINRPTVGLPNASPGKQVLGTVPVEADGSAFFRAPARIALSFQALDARGRALQVMRSITYLQPGERASCVGCHEPRTAAPPNRALGRALLREPSAIEPAPDGSKPLSYPILVQPVLDRHCVRCHAGEKPGGGVVLTGEPQGRYTASYNALAPRVSYSDWAGKPGDFRVANSEPLSRPGFFGAKGSSLMALLDAGHEDVQLDAKDLDRLVTWMDANALFYGTFDPDDQARQQRGERIAGPGLE